MATIRDVAKEAGVSVGTVSKVLNGHSVRPVTRDKVERAIRKLNYSPVQVAKGFQGQSPTVGLIIPSVSNPFFASLARSVEDAASRLGYMVLLCNTDRDPEKERRYLGLLLEKRVAGIIIFAPLTTGKDIRPVIDRGVPMVAIEHGFPGHNVDLIQIDNAKGIREAVRHLIDLGHSRIAFVSGPLTRPCNQVRLKAFEEMLLENDIQIEDALIRESSFEYEGGYHITWELLQRDEPPTAMILGNDLMAMGAANAAWEKGLDIPADLSIIGFDDIPSSARWRPKLTTVRQPIYEVGSEGVRLLIHSDNEHAIAAPTFATQLIVRESTGLCHDSHRRVVSR